MRYSVRRLGGTASILFRVRPEVVVEIYDGTAHAWSARRLEPLYRWAVVEPESGVEEITPRKRRHWAGRLFELTPQAVVGGRRCTLLL